jgi:hypothetical protein
MNRFMHNSENELIEIKMVESGLFKGEHLLIIHDDIDQGGTKAVHLLDNATIDFLLKSLTSLKENKNGE